MKGGALSRDAAERLVAPVALSELSWSRAAELFSRESGALDYAPEGEGGTDPRNGEPTLFNEKRAGRPHDYTAATGGGSRASAVAACPICAGKTTPILDLADLTEGFTFVNTNLYPVAAPGASPRSASPPRRSPGFFGLHLLQWTSSLHEADWPELSPADRLVVARRLAHAEAVLLGLEGFPAVAESDVSAAAHQRPEHPAGGPPRPGGPAGPQPIVPAGRHVSVIKNVGRSVGGSLSHGHQQMALTNVLPRRIAEDRAFRTREGRAFTGFMLEENPAELTILELETGRLVVPYFMRRPFDMQYLLSDEKIEHLCELSTTQLSDLATALARGMELLRGVLERLDVEVAYNVVFHTGTGGGLYLEFLPHTQALGGFEQLGLSACQSTPRTAAAELQEQFRNPGT